MKFINTNKINIRPESIRKKTASRICAVQTLYKISFSDINIENSMSDFIDNYLSPILNELKIKDINKDLYKKIILGVSENKLLIDDIISQNLSDKWILDRLSIIEISIFRLAVFELYLDINFSTKTIINEYVSIFDTFGGNVDFANGLLDKVSVLRINN